jgi:acyl-CoA thioester hydrolase
MSRHRYDCRVRFSDVDVYGHVNNVKYFEYYQEARLAYMAGLRGRLGDWELNLVVARVVVDYKRPILFRPEPYVVESWVTRVGKSSFGMSADIRDSDQVLSRSSSVLVTFDPATQRARQLTEFERDWLRGGMDPSVAPA